MVHQCVINSVVMWLHILYGLPEDGVTAPKHVGAKLSQFPT